MAKLTEQQKKDYLNNPNKCPHCGSVDISAGEIDADGTIGSSLVTCFDCDEGWLDIWEMTGVKEVGDE